MRTSYIKQRGTLSYLLASPDGIDQMLKYSCPKAIMVRDKAELAQTGILQRLQNIYLERDSQRKASSPLIKLS